MTKPEVPESKQQFVKMSYRRETDTETVSAKPGSMSVHNKT